MSLARGLERRLERLVDGIAAKLFGGRLEPVELATRLVREADLALTQTTLGPVVPNHFTVLVEGEPGDRGTGSEIEQELAAVLEETAFDRGWRLEGRAAVELVPEPGKGASVAITAAVVPGPRGAWCNLVPSAGDFIEVTHNRSVLGRSGQSDVHIAEDHISRSHALLWQEAGSIWVVDLESANGTTVDGTRAVEPLELGETAVLGLGDSRFAVRRT